MPVLPHRVDPFQDRKELHQFLSFCYQKSIEKNNALIASITLEVDPLDPLAVLHDMVEDDQPHFYFEKEGEAIAAIGATLQFQTEGIHRFRKAQDFIQTGLESLISNTHFPAAIPPRFFCSFTFFDQTSTQRLSFPSATVFLPRWQIVRQRDRSVVTANLTVHAKSNLETLTETVWQHLQKIRLASYGLFNLPNSLRDRFNKRQILSSNNFKAAVTSALTSIEQHQFHKLVLAHTVDVVSQLPLQWAHSLHNLRQRHPDCYVFSTSSGQGQSFIGASPERLLSIHNHRLITDALAGSAPRGNSMTEDASFANRLLSSPKERHEHQVVVDFITQRLVQFGLTPQFATSPSLLQLSNIQHLHTPIQAILPNSIHPLEILAELHPTPAVAGIPRDIACEQIQQYETFERSLYAAPLGWVDAQGNAEFIVGIRSALIDRYHARLYAGAGIVAGSDPERELAEVKLKLQTLMQALV